MNAALLPAGTNLIEVAAELLRPEGKDYSRNWVVFPEKRPGHYLRRALAAREGSGFIPPRVDSIDSFVNKFYTEHLGRRDRDVGVLDAVALLFELHRSAPDRLGREHFLTADHFFSLGVKLWNDLEELMAADFTPEALRSLEAMTEENVPAETRARLQSLAFFFEKFYAGLRERGASTRSSRFRDAAALIRREQFPGIDRFVFAGFFSLTKTEVALLKAMLAWDNFTLVLREGKGIDLSLRALGLEPACLRTGSGADSAPPTPPALEFIKAPDTHGEIFALNKALEAELRDPKLLDERRVIVLPSAETLFPLYQQTLSGLDEEKDFNISLGYPLARTPVYSFFDNLLELVQSMDEEGRVYVPNYLRFVLHPYTKNLYFPGFDKRADLTRVLFHAVEEEFARRKTKAFWSLKELEEDPGIREAIRDLSRGVEGAPEVAAFLEHLAGIHRRCMAPFQVLRNAGDFARKLIAVLDFIYENGTARQHRFFHPYAESFRDQLEGLARSLLRDVAFNDRPSYFHLFRRIMSGGTVPFYGTPLSGLQVLGFWETRGIPFEEVNILDMNETVIPAFSRVESLLPTAARRALGLPTYLDHEWRMEYALDNLIAGARRVRFFFIENADKERSRFLEKLIWEKAKTKPRRENRAPLSLKDVPTVSYQVSLAPAKSPPLAKTPDVVEFLRGYPISATALDTYLKCPLQFYFGYVLNLQERQEVGEDLEKKELGTLVHAILEDYFKPLLGRRLKPADLDPKRLGAVADAFFRRAFGEDPSGTAYLTQVQARRHLMEFIALHQAPLVRDLEGRPRGVEILSLEKKLDWELKVGDRTFRLTGKVDRTETRQGQLYVLDYKSAWNEKNYGLNFKKFVPEDRASWNQAVRSLQLPFYAMLLSRIHGKPSADIHCRFVMLGKNRLGPQVEFSPYDEEDEKERARQIKAMEDLIGRLLLEVTDGRVPFDPDLASEQACGWCAYTALCSRL